MDERRSRSRALLRFSYILIGAGIGISTLFQVAGPWYVRMLLPLFSWEIQGIRPNYEVRGFTLNERQEIMFTIDVDRETFGEKGEVLETVRRRGGIMGKTAYISPIIALTLVLAWPGATWRERGLALFVSFPLGLLAQMSDMPFHIVNRVEMVWPDVSLGARAREFWVHIMNNGGRQFLGILVGILSVRLGRWQLPGRPSGAKGMGVGRNDSCPCGSGKKFKKCCGA